MPIIKLVPKRCYCDGKPKPKTYGEGTVWECDNPDCRAHWQLQYDFRGFLYWAKLLNNK